MRYCKLLLIILFSILFNLPARAQCKGDFSFKSFPSVKSAASGKIEINLKNADYGSYSFKVYRVSGEIKLIQKKELQSPQVVVFDNLEPSDYYVKIEWGGSCKKTIGGIEGIQITEKAEGK